MSPPTTIFWNEKKCPRIKPLHVSPTQEQEYWFGSESLFQSSLSESAGRPCHYLGDIGAEGKKWEITVGF
jgi:hypothetical protein